jgi:DNA repair exonuclease SbcCD ATPase subunit
MKVESIEIKNFKAIAEENLTISGNNVYVLGQNGVGKTSFIDAIFKTISGKYPIKPTKQNSKRGHIEIDLGECVVKAIFSEGNEKVELSIVGKDGKPLSKPRTTLDKFAGIVDFDIMEFFNKRPKEQVDFIKQLIGVDFTDLDDQYKEFYEKRTYINARVKELEPQQIPFDKTKINPIDITGLQSKLQKANDENSKIKEVKSRQTERVSRITSIKTQIESLQKELTEIEEKQSQAKEWLSKNTEIDITSIQEEFNKAIDHNKQVENTIKASKLRQEFEKALEEQKALNEDIETIQETKKRIISESKIPVPGMTFDDDQLYLDGLPFEKSQINTARLIIAGLQINLALLKDIKIARFDGSLLDNKNIGEVEKWAKENGLQLFVEFVDRNEEGLKIEIKEQTLIPA